jgi:putative ABC transport system permease protein
MIKDYFQLAYQGVKHRKLRSWLTMLGIFVGIAAVVALISLSQGLQTAIEDRFESLGADKLIVSSSETGFGPPGTGVINHLTEKDKAVIEKVRGVRRVVGRLIRSARIGYHDEVKFGFLVSLPMETSEQLEFILEVMQIEVANGRMLEPRDSYNIVIGDTFSRSYFDEKINLRDKIIIEGKEFKVVGILEKQGEPQTDSLVILPEKTMKEILNINDEFDLIALQVDNVDDIDKVEDDIKKDLRKHRGLEEGKEDFQVSTPGSILETLNNVLLIVQGVLIGLASISLLVGGIGIMNTMYTSVLQRTKEIGIMKSVGAKRNEILLIFLIEAGILGLFGGIIGVCLGMGISKSIEYFAFQYYGTYLIQADFNLVVILSVLLFAFIVGMVSGTLPARQAAKLDPVEALRK